MKEPAWPSPPKQNQVVMTEHALTLPPRLDTPIGLLSQQMCVVSNEEACSQITINNLSVIISRS